MESDDLASMTDKGVPSREEFEVHEAPEIKQEPDSPYEEDDSTPYPSPEKSSDEDDTPVYPQDLVKDKPAPIRVMLISNMPRVDIDDRNLKMDLSQVDLVISLGNVDLAALDQMMLPSTQGVCVFAPDDQLAAPPRFHRLHGNGITFRKWKIAGISGRLVNGPTIGGLYLTPEDSQAMLDSLPASDIFISHAPPRDIREAPVSPGLTMPAIDRYLSTKHPIYHFYSHPALNEAVEAYGGEYETITVGVSGHQLAPLIEYV